MLYHVQYFLLYVIISTDKRYTLSIPFIYLFKKYEALYRLEHLCDTLKTPSTIYILSETAMKNRIQD